MTDEIIKSEISNAQSEIIKDQLEKMEIRLALDDQPVDIEGAFKLPLDFVTSLGVAFSSLPEAFRTIKTSVNIPTLLQATDKFGKPIDPSILQSFKDGSGLLGSYRDSVKGFGQARFHIVKGNVGETVTKVPYDPTTLFMAAALYRVNQKLDCIQECVDEMYQYMRQRDKADMRGNLRTLSGILNDYSLNCDNATYISNAHMKVLDIKQKSEQDMELFRSLAQAGLKKEGIVEVRFMMETGLEKAVDYLKDYRLSLFIHAFSVFLEPMLAQNFQQDKLNAVANLIEQEALDYRLLYTNCYNVIETRTVKSLDSAVLGSVSSLGKGIGKVVAATPIGDLTPIDEALENAGEGIGRFNDDQSSRLIQKLHDAKTPDVVAFKECIDDINKVFNQPSRLAIDAENVYILPYREIE